MRLGGGRGVFFRTNSGMRRSGRPTLSPARSLPTPRLRVNRKARRPAEPRLLHRRQVADNAVRRHVVSDPMPPRERPRRLRRRGEVVSERAEEPRRRQRLSTRHDRHRHHHRGTRRKQNTSFHWTLPFFHSQHKRQQIDRQSQRVFRIGKRSCVNDIRCRKVRGKLRPELSQTRSCDASCLLDFNRRYVCRHDVRHQ